MEALPEKINSIERKLDALTGSVDARFAAVNDRFAAVDARFDAVDARFDEVTSALVEQRQYTEFAFDRLRGEMTTGFGRLERKLDHLIDRLIGPHSAA